MAKKGVMNIMGFEDLLLEIEKANGQMDRAVESAVKASSKTVYNEMKKQMAVKSVDSGLINRMPPPTFEQDGNTFTARVGYKKGSYNPKDLSDGYKAVFINYGTPRISPREFIKAAKKKAAPQVKKQQKEVFEKVLERLKK